ncbi:hypothetical protein EPO15_10675 [bacterium]|nr:MAG: hypothetical protein EPO15_10675 [bacterium]
MAELVAEVAAARGLSEAERRELHALFSRHYDNVPWELFSSDFAEKDFVILLRRGRGGPVAGFSTQKVLRAEPGGHEMRVLFSGDTVIDKEAWGEQGLVKAWCLLAGALKSQRPDTPLYWLLICKGYRTYLYLPLFFTEYWPRHETPTPPKKQALLDAFAKAKFGRAYSAKKGLLRFKEAKGNLTSALAEIPAGRKDDPRVRFFLERNPGYAKGDELVCLTEVSEANTKGLAKRLYKEGFALGLPGLLSL